MSQSADSRYTVTYRYGADGQRSTKYARGMNESETMYFSKMWEWRYDEAAGGRERNSKHIFLGETRVVTKVLADASVVAGERESEYFYHSDHLGSAQLISDYEGREYERIEYTPYGETWVDRKEAVDTIELTYRFTGKEVDEETGLYYYGARYLDPRTSRWLSTDPALGEYIPGAPVNEEAKKANQNLPGMGGVFNVVNFQLYHYAGNNPVKYMDPDGRFVFALPAIPVLIDLGLKGLAILAAGAAGWKAGEKLAEAKADSDRRQAENAPSPVNQRSLSAEAIGEDKSQDNENNTGDESSKKHTPDQQALNGLAKDAKKQGGISQEDGKTLVEWGQEVGLPSRGPEGHPNRPYGKEPHIHIGSQDHIPIKE